MPNPVYMLCCLSGAVDKNSNQISHFNVVEQLQLNIAHRPAEESEGVFIGTPLRFQIVATWARGPTDDPNDRYEAELSLERPEDKTPQIMQKSEFRFEKRSHRFLVNFVLVPRPEAKSGVFRFESRIRKKGGRKWLRQEYSIPFEVMMAGDTPQTNRKTKRRTKKR